MALAYATAASVSSGDASWARSAASRLCRGAPDALGSQTDEQVAHGGRIADRTHELTHDAEAAVERDRAASPSDVAGDEAHDGRLPDPVGADERARSPSPTWKDTSSISTAPPGRRQVTWLSWIAPTGRTI